jgi:hypothetical protein
MDEKGGLISMEREKREALEWFVQFANMDLGQLKPGDRAKLLVESGEYLSPTKDVEQFREHLELIQGRGSLEDLKNTPGQFWQYIVSLQGVVKRTLESIFNFSFPPPKIFKHARELIWSGNLYGAVSYKSEKFYFSFLPLTTKDEEYIEFKLYQVLDGLFISTLQRCPGCTKYYLNFTKRRKRFCSPKCMWKVNAEKRREELRKHPSKYKAYLNKQRVIMRKKYEEKRKAESGPNVKVGRKEG